MKLIVFTSAVAVATAFVPATSIAKNSAIHSAPTEEADVIQESEAVQDSTPKTAFEVGAVGGGAAAALNGWTPNESQPCYGLPGALAPTGYFDPLGFCRFGNTLNDVKRYREAEVQHGRVAMLASVGYLAGEAFPSPFGIDGPANDQLQQTPTVAFALLTAGIAAAELKRATIGWVEPDLGKWTKTLFTLRENYYPGDLGFDPLGLKPSDAKEFADMQTRELQNGRLAMLGVAGMCAQELVNHKTISATIDFYEKVYSGIDPYL